MRYLAHVFLICLLASGCKRKPCTGDNCANIAGDYKETTKQTTVNCTVFAEWWAPNATIHLTQEGSAITMVRDVAGGDAMTLTGTLYDNGSITLSATRALVHNLTTGQLVPPVDISLTGSYRDGTFSGSYNMTQMNPCAFTTAATWVKQ